MFNELRTQPSILVLDDLHWADQGTIDLFRFLLRRAPQTQLLTIGIARDDEVSVTHPLRGLLGDVARSPHAQSLVVPPLSVDAITTLVGDRDVDPAWLHRVTGGNAFFVCEMLDHHGADLPTTVRDAILARTAGLDIAAWDLLNLLTCAPGSIPDHLMTDLGVTLPALRALDEAKLIRRDARGVAFRHDLCRRAVTSVIPPGAEPALHRRFIDAHQASAHADPAVSPTTHSAQATRALITSAAADAGRRPQGPVRTPRPPSSSGSRWSVACATRRCTEAELFELLADRVLPHRPPRRRDRGVPPRDADPAGHGRPVAVSADHHSLAVYEWYNGNREPPDDHVADAIATLDGVAATRDPAVLTSWGMPLRCRRFWRSNPARSTRRPNFWFAPAKSSASHR